MSIWTPRLRTRRTATSTDPSRRGFLLGTGAALALPWLEGLNIGTAHAQNAGVPRRFLAFFVPNGFNMAQFWPRQVGPLDQNSFQGTSLTSLAPYAQQLLLINGLDNHAGSAQGDGPGDHARGTSTFLTCTHPRKHASDVSLGVSVDQILAQHFAEQTRFASVEIGCEGGGNAGACDSGYSCAYQRNIAWRDEQTPLPKETNPRLLFQRLFGGFNPSLTEEVRARMHRRRMSVLDFVLDDAQRLQRHLGQDDRRRLDDYMTSIRSVETRLDEIESSDTQCYPEGDIPPGAPSDRGAYATLMLDMLTDAMRCDLTRVGTFMFGNGGSNRSHSEAGVGIGHHELSHHQHDPAKLAQIAQIDAWEISIFARLVERLSSTDMGGHSLLDETTVFFGSEVEDGNRHYHYNLPVIMAGRSGGLDTGRYIDLRGEQNNNEPIANLFMRILEDAGRPVDSFGDDGTRPLNV